MWSSNNNTKNNAKRGANEMLIKREKEKLEKRKKLIDLQIMDLIKAGIILCMRFFGIKADKHLKF